MEGEELSCTIESRCSALVPSQLGSGASGARKHAVERMDFFCAAREKSAIKVYHTEKLPELFLCRWLRELLNSLHSGGERADAGGVDRVPQEVELWLAKNALAYIDDKPVLGQASEQRSEV